MSDDLDSGGRPNIVLFLTDQHRADHVGFGGNEVVQTPNLDALAESGTAFTEAFVANPICMPNRATILAGRMPSAHGTRFNGIPLDWDTNTFARQLRRAGYDTALVGKAHFQNMGHGGAMIEMLRAGWPDHEAVERPRPAGWDLLEDDARYREGEVATPDDYYGFAHVDFAVGHADVVGGHYWRWLLDQGVDPSTIQGPASGPPTFADWWQIWRTATPVELYPTTYVGRRAVEYVESRAGADEPFFLQCSFPDPHHPFTPPGEYFDLFDPADVPLPATFDDPHDQSPRHLRSWRDQRGATPPPIPVMPFAPTEAVYREAAAREYGSIALIDDVIGTVVAAVERTGKAADTIVVFTSDHGEMFGDHGLMLKGAMHYRGALRVPLVIADPRRDGHGSRCASLVGSLDLAQTMLDLAGVDEYAGMQGTPLTPLLDDPTATVRDSVLVEEDEPFDLAQTGAPLRMRTLITGEGRLTIYAGSDEGELFEFGDDPDELHNRFSEPQARTLRADLFERLARTQMELADAGNLPTSGA